MTDDFFTLLAGVGIQTVIAGDTVRLVLHLYVLASAQGFVAVFAVELVTHDVLFLLTSCRREGSQAQISVRDQPGGLVGRKRRRRRRRKRSEISRDRDEKQDEGRQTTRETEIRPM